VPEFGPELICVGIAGAETRPDGDTEVFKDV